MKKIVSLKKLMPKRVELLLIPLASPLLVGVYEDARLIRSIESHEKSSEYLPLLFRELLEEYEIKALYYANGPGSFMAIKVAYIFLKSLSILKEIPLYGADAFCFNDNAPIKAIGKLCFVKIASQIETQKLQSVPESTFRLPQQLVYEKFTPNAAPLYMISAVGS